MASASMSSKTSFHVRSNSLPSKPHPLILEADEHLCRLRASSEATSSSSSSHKLSNLFELYDCVDKLLLLPLTQQSLAQESHEKLLDGSLRLLDLCETSKDVLFQTKEFVYQLKSALRRRRSEVGLVNELRTCLISRKTIKKAVQKLLKRVERKNVEKNEENIAVIGLLKEVESVTLDVVKSLLSDLSGSKRSNWSIVSRLMGSKRVANEDEESDLINEIDAIDAALQNITIGSNKTAKLDRSTQMEHLQNSVEKLESNIQDFEDSLDGLCRQLIKIRVSLLNIFNH